MSSSPPQVATRALLAVAVCVLGLSVPMPAPMAAPMEMQTGATAWASPPDTAGATVPDDDILDTVPDNAPDTAPEFEAAPTDGTEPTVEPVVQPVVEPVGDAVTAVTGERATIALRDMGLGDGFGLVSSLDSRDFVVAVPDSMRLVEWAADLTTSASAHDVLISVSVDGNVVFEQRYDGAVDDTIRADLGARTGEATVTVTATDLDPASCTGAGAGGPVINFANAQLTLDHDPDVVPVAVADFLPPLLERAVVVVPDEPSHNELSGAYALAAALGRRAPVAPRFSIVHDDDATAATVGSSDPFERVFILRDGNDSLIEVTADGTDAVMILEAADGELAALAAALSEPEIGFITTPSADGVTVADQPSGDELLRRRELSDAGVRSLEVSGGRSLDFAVGLPQSQFGQPVASFRLQLSGFVLSGGTPTVSVRLNDRLIEVLELGPTGGFETIVDIDSRTIERDNAVVIRSELAGCGESSQQQIVLDAASWVEAAPGQALSASIDRFPQAGMPELLVATGGSSDEQALALAVIASMQQSSPLALEVVSSAVDDALVTDDAALLVTDGAASTGPAVSAALGRASTGSGASDDGDDGLAPGLATIVAGENEVGGDLIAVLARGDDPASEALVEQLRLQGWASFSGRAVGVDPDGQRVVESAAGRVPPAELDALDEVEPPTTTRNPLVLFGLGALAVLGLVVVVVSIRSVVAIFTGSRAR